MKMAKMVQNMSQQAIASYFRIPLEISRLWKCFRWNNIHNICCVGRKQSPTPNFHRENIVLVLFFSLDKIDSPSLKITEYKGM